MKLLISCRNVFDLIWIASFFFFLSILLKIACLLVVTHEFMPHVGDD